MKTFFINEAFDKAINEYLSSKDNPNGTLYNSFFAVVIRLLINIYGELDIISPFHFKNEQALYDNLMKFGMNKEQIDEFFKSLENYYIVEKRNETALKREENTYFIDVQKRLIDMFNIKRLNFGLIESDRREFFDLLYTPGTSHFLRQTINFKSTSNIYEVAEYFKKMMEQEIEKTPEEEKDLLSFDVYKLFGFKISDISKMDDGDVNKLNRKIYESFDINENAINKDYLLNEKIKELQMQRLKVTTGNGYVDILLIMSVIVTTVMVVVIFGTLIF